VTGRIATEHEGVGQGAKAPHVRASAYRRGAARDAAAFVFVTLATSTSLLLPAALARRGILAARPERFAPLVVLGYFAPTLAAALLSATEKGEGGVRKLFRQLGRWRVDPRWYVIALALPGAVFVASKAVVTLATGAAAGPWVYLPDAQRIAAMLVIPLADQVGWRGFAFPRWQARYGSLNASLVLGVAWGLWHVTKQELVGVSPPLALIFVMVGLFAAANVVLTWIYNHANRSLLLVVVAQGGFYLNNPSQALPDHLAPLAIQASGYCVLALALGLLDRRAFFP
jgi:uncharacterized protein